MNRRQFLYTLTTFFASLWLGRIPLLAQETKGVPGVLRDMLIIDAHAHPARILRSESIKLATRALAIKNMKQLGAVTSSFSAVGDVQKGTSFYDRVPAQYEQVIEQLNRAKEVIEFPARRPYESPLTFQNPLIPETKSALFWRSKGQNPLKASRENLTISINTGPNYHAHALSGERIR